MLVTWPIVRLAARIEGKRSRGGGHYPTPHAAAKDPFHKPRTNMSCVSASAATCRVAPSVRGQRFHKRAATVAPKATSRRALAIQAAVDLNGACIPCVYGPIKSRSDAVSIETIELRVRNPFAHRGAPSARAIPRASSTPRNFPSGPFSIALFPRARSGRFSRAFVRVYPPATPDMHPPNID